MREWWIDETAFAGAEHLDDAHVAGYDAKAQFDPGEDVRILADHGMGPGSTVLDVGAGTGVFAHAAAATGADVIAVDVSPAMVAAIDTRTSATRVSGSVRAVRAGFLGYEHDGDPVDVVYSRNALHQLPDLWKVVALDRLAAVLRPGGILRLRDLCFDAEPATIDTVIDEWMAGPVTDPARGYTTADFVEHVRSEFSTFTWLLEPMLERCGFEILDREVRRSVYAAYTCRRS